MHNNNTSSGNGFPNIIVRSPGLVSTPHEAIIPPAQDLSPEPQISDGGEVLDGAAAKAKIGDVLGSQISEHWTVHQDNDGAEIKEGDDICESIEDEAPDSPEDDGNVKDADNDDNDMVNRDVDNGNSIDNENVIESKEVNENENGQEGDSGSEYEGRDPSKIGSEFKAGDQDEEGSEIEEVDDNDDSGNLKRMDSALPYSTRSTRGRNSIHAGTLLTEPQPQESASWKRVNPATPQYRASKGIFGNIPRTPADVAAENHAHAKKTQRSAAPGKKFYVAVPTAPIYPKRSDNACLQTRNQRGKFGSGRKSPDASSHKSLSSLTRSSLSQRLLPSGEYSQENEDTIADELQNLELISVDCRSISYEYHPSSKFYLTSGDIPLPPLLPPSILSQATSGPGLYSGLSSESGSNQSQPQLLPTIVPPFHARTSFRNPAFSDDTTQRPILPPTILQPPEPSRYHTLFHRPSSSEESPLILLPTIVQLPSIVRSHSQWVNLGIAKSPLQNIEFPSMNDDTMEQRPVSTQITTSSETVTAQAARELPKSSDGDNTKETQRVQKKQKPPAVSPFFTPTTSPFKKAKTLRKNVKEIPESPPENSPSNSTPKKSRSLSCIPFPPLSSGSFGLIQERLAEEPFDLLIAVTMLHKTKGKVAIPAFHDLKSKYATPTELATADIEDIKYLIRHLGLQNKRAVTFQVMAKKWAKTPPLKGKRYVVRKYPMPESGKGIKKDTVLDDDDEREAWEVGHLTQGPYTLDSWRIFCRDKLRGLASGWNGEDAAVSFQPEWMRVLPEDKELRAFLRWMWLKEGFEWDPLTGDKEAASAELLKAAREGNIAWDDRGGMRVICAKGDTGDSAADEQSLSDAVRGDEEMS